MVEEVISKAERTSTTQNKSKDVVLEDIQKVGNAINELIKKDPKSFEEVFSAVKSRYYLDEMVFVSDLLKESDLYNYEPFVNQNASLYSFRKSFESLKNTIEVDKVNENITLYIPYSENHDFSNFSSITVVTAQEDTNEASGIRYGKEGFTKVSVNDKYAQENLTIIVGINQMREDASTYKDEEELEKSVKKHDDKSFPERVNRVEAVTHVSNSKAIMRVNLDAIISFTGNGGGNDMRMARISVYLTPVNGHTTSFDGDKQSKSMQRGDVGKVITVSSIWDSNWANDDFEQIYAVYEEDTENSQTFSGSLTSTLTATVGAISSTRTGTVGYSVTIKSKDPIVTQTKMKKADYMLFNAPTSLNQLNNGNKACILDRTFLPLVVTTYWPAYGCGADWSYTLPHEQF
jgi:hypothetical protein